MDDPKDAALNFEAVKLGMTQDKNGHILKLAVHPNDTPEDLFRDLVGSRYVVAMVKIDDEGEPVKPPSKAKTDKIVAQAGLLCRNDRFWEYLEDLLGGDLVGVSIGDEFKARDALCEYLGIESRAELKTDKEAREQFMGMVGEFEAGIRK